MQFHNSTMTNLRRWLLGLLIVVGSCCGCTPTAASRQAVSGTVTLNSAPVTGVTLVFTPVAGNQLGTVAEVVDGQFALDAETGLAPGKYDVTVDTHEPDLEDFERLREAGRRPFSSYKIAPRFSRIGTLEAEVLQGTQTVLRFDLNSR